MNTSYIIPFEKISKPGKSWRKKSLLVFVSFTTGAPNESIVQNHLNRELLNVF